MYRRIEQIHDFGPCKKDGTPWDTRFFKTGLCGISTAEVTDAWADLLKAPPCGIPDNCRFYFTELGWEKIGRQVVAACQRSGQAYRVLCIKENAIDVVYRDEYQVAGQPKRRWRKEGRRRARKRGTYW